MKKDQKLREMILSNDVRFLMEAHNGLSAKIAEEAGFEGIWASGLSISAQLGVRDNNEASWTQVLEVVEFMSDATTVPILLDGDTGYGNFNNMRRLVRKLEQRDVAGVCIEDKLFPKTNSFIRGTAQPLADTDEFCGKIKAGKDAQTSDNFNIVARVEAFIAGWGLKEALRRAELYRQAGADAILIHSALKNPSEILEFKKEWADRHPVVIVPTKYYTTPTEVFREYKFSIVIWANHLMRTAVTAMQNTARQIYQDQNLLAVEENIASVSEVFRLQGETELAEAEKRYLPTSHTSASAIILAASRGKELGELTDNIPKAMIPIRNKPLLAHIIENYREVNIKQLCVVRGYRKEQVNIPAIDYADNDDYETTGEVYSLFQAKEKLKGNVIVSYGDVLFKKHILYELSDNPGDFVIVVDYQWEKKAELNRPMDFVQCSEPKSNVSFYNTVSLKSIGVDKSKMQVHGEWTGILKLSAKGSEIFKKLLEDQFAKNAVEFKNFKLPDILRSLLSSGQNIEVQYIAGDWLDVDLLDDVIAGSGF